jgi:hypothetical protein
MKKVILFFLMAVVLVISAPSLTAQEKEKNSVFKLSLIPLHGAYEVRARGHFTLVAQAGLGFNVEIKKDATKSSFPRYVLFGARYYYNEDKRRDQGKRVDKFAANYLGIIVMNMFESPGFEKRLALGPVWGLQRNIGKNGFWEFAAGLEYNFMEGKDTFGGHLGISLGFSF